MHRTKKVLATAAVGLVLLSGCAKATAEDRSDSTGNGKKPDSTGDATHVDLFRNADGVPTLILFCAGPLRFASTPSSLGTNGSDQTLVQPSLLRVPEQDTVCTGKAQ